MKRHEERTGGDAACAARSSALLQHSARRDPRSSAKLQLGIVGGMSKEEPGPVLAGQMPSGVSACPLHRITYAYMREPIDDTWWIALALGHRMMHSPARCAGESTYGGGSPLSPCRDAALAFKLFPPCR